MNGSSMIGNPARTASSTARALASRVAAVPASPRAIRTSVFAKSRPSRTIPATS